MHFRMNINSQSGSPYPFVDEFKRSSVTPYSATGDSTSFVSKEDMLSELKKYKKKDHSGISVFACAFELAMIIFIFTSFSILMKATKELDGRLDRLENMMNNITNSTALI
jgi:hypothetical protein